ncbi:hypothetical protein ACFL27_27820, partial [candidate division CSSED10-310 bacterium]
IICLLWKMRSKIPLYGLARIQAKGSKGEKLFEKGIEAYRENEFYTASSLFERAITELMGEEEYRPYLKSAFLCIFA